MSQITNPLGTFTQTYEGDTGILNEVQYPLAGMKTTYQRLPAAQDRLLTAIIHTKPTSQGGGELARYDYLYNAQHQIATWRQMQPGMAAKEWAIAYDTRQQVTAVVETPVAGPPQNPQQVWRYQYDASGNRTAAQEGSRTRTATYNELNQLVSQSAGGSTWFRGKVNEPANVTIAGQNARVSADGTFESLTPVGAGQQDVVMQATDKAGNTTSQTWRVDNGPAGTVTTTHDTEGNLLTDGRYTYTWDAKNRMTSVTLGADTWSFQYDGLNRRFLEAQPNMEKIWVWQDTKPLMMKQSDGVTLRFWHGGYEIDDPQLVTPRKMLHVHDHLESVRVVINEASGQIESSWGYGPTGKRTAFVTGHEELFGYCSHEQHPSGLSLALFRTLNPNSGCWVSRDPFMEDVSLNLYSLASGNPVNQADPLRLETYEQFQARCQARAKASCASKGCNLKTWGTVRLGAGSGYRGDTLFVWSSFACTYECGSCSPEEQQRRQALKNAACAKEHSCSCGMGRVKLLEYTRNAYACYDARLNVMHCFDGGDSAHRSQADAAFRAFQNCAYLLSSSSRP